MELLYVFLSIISIIWISKTLFNKKKNLPPSPFPCLPIIGHLYLVKSPLYRSLGKISDRYGPMLRLQFGTRPFFLVSSPAAIEECLTTNDINFANRPHFLAGKYLGYNYTSLFWSDYGDHWRGLRRIATVELLSSHRLQTLNAIRAEEVQLLVKRVHQSAMKDGTVEMKSMFFELMLNVLMMMIAGKRYYGDSSADMDEAQSFKKLVKESFLVMESTDVSNYIPWLKWVVGNEMEKKMAALGKRREEFMQSLIDENRRNRIMEKDDNKNHNFIEVLLKLQESQPEYYKDEIIKGLMQVLLSGGSDTSSAAMEWTLSLLLNNPETLKKAQEEIDRYIGDEDRLINESDLSKLPYLRCIINESMRMHPPGPLVFHAAEKDCTVGGYHIPGGTILLMNFWAMQNDPKNWEEPEKFKPERFVGLEGSKNVYNLLPFGAGRRSCPAENLALKVVGLAVGTLIQCFEWERTSNDMIDMSLGKGLTMTRAKPLLAKCQPRGKMSNLLSISIVKENINRYLQ